MKKIITISVVLCFCTFAAFSQFTKQVCPLGSGDAAMLGKVQFVSPTEGWIACGANGSLLHTTNSGENWNIVTPFPSEITGNMSDPAVSMSWVNQTHGWALKTYVDNFDDRHSSSNGAVVYKTINGGTSWTKKTLPKTITTVNYNSTDLVGNWQMHMLSARNPNESGSKSSWMYGNGTVNSSGAFTGTLHHGDGTTTTDNFPILLSKRGKISINSEELGFLSADKQIMIISGFEANDSPSLYILQKQNNAITYSVSDFQGDWYMHGLSSGTADTGSKAGYVYGTMSFNSGAFSGTLHGPDNSSFTASIPGNISSDGIITFGTNTHGFMSADKQSFVAVMTDDGGAYNLIVFQKKSPSTIYSVSDLLGLWQGYSLVSDNPNDTNPWVSWGRQQFQFTSTGGATISNMIVNNETRDDMQTSVLLSLQGVMTIDGLTDSNGFLSPDKSLLIFTNPDGSGGYSFAVMMRDLSISGDIGMQLQFANETAGWASTYNQIYNNFRIFRTADGGENWTQINGETNPVGGFYYFVDAQNGWMIGQKGATQSQLFSILRTTDGGLSWEVQKSDVGYSEDIFFTDLTHGWVVGKNGLILRTKDGGVNWEKITPEVNYPSGYNDIKHKSVFFTDAQNGFISVDLNNESTGFQGNYILKTTDGGDNWTALLSPVSYSIFDMYFTDSNNGWLTGDYGEIVRYQTPTGVNNIDKSKISIYPNPTDKGFYLPKELIVNEIIITDMRGAKVLNIVSENNYVDVSALQKGVYIIQFQTQDGIYRGKLIKK